MLQMPDLLYFNGSWQEYIDDVYDVVREDILISNITFKGLPVRLRYSPEYNGKEFGFLAFSIRGKK